MLLPIFHPCTLSGQCLIIIRSFPLLSGQNHPDFIHQPQNFSAHLTKKILVGKENQPPLHQDLEQQVEADVTIHIPYRYDICFVNVFRK